MPPPADTVKVAIEWPGAYPKLMEIDQVSNAGCSLAIVCSFRSILEFSQTLGSSFFPFLFLAVLKNLCNNGCSVCDYCTMCSGDAWGFHTRPTSTWIVSIQGLCLKL